MKYSFIVNPCAGKGKFADELACRIEKSCRERDLNFEIYRTRGIGDATQYITRTANERTEDIRFYACGGDGTLGEAVQGIMSASDREGLSLGLFPIGTGNDFVRNFTPRETFMDVESQIDALPMSFDLLRCNERHAMNMINIGFDCEVVCKTVSLKKSPLIPSKFAYIAGLVVTLVRKPGVSMRLGVDGEEPSPRKYLLTTFANGKFCGGGFHSNPKASLDDGKLDVLLIKDVTRRTFLSLVGDYKKGTHLAPKLRHIIENRKADRVDMYFDGETNISVDGEIHRVKELHLSVLPSALHFLIPKGAAVLA